MFNALLDWGSRRLSTAGLAHVYRTVSPRWASSLSLHRFRQTVRYAAKRSPFYREAFAKRGIDATKVRQPADLGDFFTTPDDLQAQPEQFICRPPNIVFESSGTSGRNKRVYYGHDEMTEMGRSMASGFQLMGVTPEDRIANAFDFSMWIPGMITHYGLMAAGNFCMAFGKVDPIEVYRRLREYNFTVVMGEPTWLIRLTELAEQDGGNFPLKLLVGGAEEMPANAVGWMEKVWRGAKLRMCYGSVEQGSALGFQPCDQAYGYHLDHIDFAPEMVDVDAEGYGEVVFTTLQRTVMPLIRYRTRDVARMYAEPCACGIRAPRITRIRGRRDELVVASGGNLYPLMFENILRPIVGLTHDWQVVFTLEGVREVLEIHVESERDSESEISAEVMAQATRQYPDLMKNLALGIFQMRVIVHRPGEVRQKRKLKRLVDRRHFDLLPPSNGEAIETPVAVSH